MWCIWNPRVQIPTRIPEKVVVALFSGILVISGIVVVAGRQLTNYQVSQARFCALRDFLLVSEMLDSKRCKLRRPLKGTKSVQSHLALKELNWNGRTFYCFEGKKREKYLLTLQNSAKNLRTQAKTPKMDIRSCQKQFRYSGFRYLVNKKLRRRPFFRYSSEFRYLGFRYSSRYLYSLSLCMLLFWTVLC